MALIKVDRFAGQTPRLSPRLLAPEQAQSAVNCKLWSGELRPFRGLARVRNLECLQAPKTLYRLGQRFWLHFQDHADIVRGPVPGDRYERTYITGLGAPRVTDARLAAKARHDGQAIACRFMGVPAPQTAPMARINRTGAGAFESRAYVYTFVNEYGEEGPPSPPSRAIDVSVDASVLLSGMEHPPVSVAGLDTAIAARRVYRTETPGDGAAFFSFVAEIDARLTGFVDNKPSSDLGELLASASWYPPPMDMQGLIALPNGVMAGFTGNAICFSEPFTPHAWPPEYRLFTDQPIVALGAYDTTIVAATTAHPYLVTGATPAAMSMSRLPGRQACVSRRGLVSSEAGVVYPTPDGLYLIGPKAGVLVTRDLFTRDEWQALSPQTMHAVIHDGRLFIFHGHGGPDSGGLILDRAEPSAGLTRLDFHASAAYSDTGLDHLYLALDSPSGPCIAQWEGEAAAIPYTWRSKTFLTPRPHNMAAAKVLADYPDRLSEAGQAALNARRSESIAANRAQIIAGAESFGALNGRALADLAVNADTLQKVPPPYQEPPGLRFSLHGDGKQRLTREVLGPGLLRLPAGYTAREWEIELTADFAVRELRLAPSAEEIGE